MKKNKKGHYVLFNYEAPVATVREMERQMGLNEDVLRLLTLRTDDLPEEPSVVMANRNERGGRYGRDRPRSDRDDSSSDKPSTSSDSSGPARENKGDSA